MSALNFVDLGLALLVLAIAGWTIAAREAFAAIVAYVAYGLLLSIVWVRIFAVDVAMTEAAIGSGVTGVLLISAAARLRGVDAPPGEKPSLNLRLGAGALCAFVTIALAAVIFTLPAPAPGLAPDVAAHLPATGVGNPITGVLIAFRSFDTLLEKIVLLLAIIGVWSLAPDRFWGGVPAPPRAARPVGALTFLAQLLAPVGIVVGVHIVWVGADEPGGAFQGGAILAAMWMIVIMSRLSDAPPVSARWLRAILIAGPSVFLAVGVCGLFTAGAFFALPQAFAKPLILFIEAFMTLSIAATLPMLVAGPPQQAPPR